MQPASHLRNGALPHLAPDIPAGQGRLDSAGPRHTQYATRYILGITAVAPGHRGRTLALVRPGAHDSTPLTCA